MSRSVTRRSSFALVSVVSMRSWAMRLAARFLNIARRWLAFRPNLRPALRCRMTAPLVAVLLRLPALEHLGPVVDLHAQRKAHTAQDLFDLLQRLAAEVLGLEHVLLGPLHQLADEGDVGVLQAIGRTDGELELVDGTEEVVVERFVFAAWRRVGSFFAFLEIDPDGELLFQDLGREGHGVGRL